MFLVGFEDGIGKFMEKDPWTSTTFLDMPLESTEHGPAKFGFLAFEISGRIFHKFCGTVLWVSPLDLPNVLGGGSRH